MIDPDDRRLVGKRIAVTGASRGLGRSVALALAGSGADLVVNATNADLLAETCAEISALGAQVIPVVGSVADDAIAERIVAACVESYGGIDVLVNNAGIVRDRTLMNMSPLEFDEVIAVNLRGTWSTSRHAARAMRDTGGLLLQVISAAAMVGSVGQTNYAASKAGVLGMMYAWDIELARYGIRTNALFPIADTQMTEVVVKRLADEALAGGRLGCTAQTLGYGPPDDVAEIAVYLASDAAAHLRSQIITFNGSKLALWQHPVEVGIQRRTEWTLDEIGDAIDAHGQQAVFVCEF